MVRGESGVAEPTMKIIQIVPAIGLNTATETIAFYALTEDGQVWMRVCDSKGWQWRKVPPIE